ncbi:hypothetical protein RA210_U390013 [Rubrivivax sp. A210]|nr:hypothetical protein RA210_U390013 [Rubrivivax sp. A210]
MTEVLGPAARDRSRCIGFDTPLWLREVDLCKCSACLALGVPRDRGKRPRPLLGCGTVDWQWPDRVVPLSRPWATARSGARQA